VNNAGLGFFDPLQQAKLEHWHEMIDTNIKGILNAFHAAMPHLIEARGHVINIGSVSSHLVFPNSGVYSATKHAVLAISESIRIELSGKIGVTTISPGAVNTPFIEQTTNAQLLQELRPGFAGGLAPETIAEQIAFVLSHEGRAVISEIIIRPDKRV
jgi:NADP-dependent 3-hydroxy acid dehydrogenase YdfG